RLIAGEVPGELGGDMLRRRWIGGKVEQDRFRLLLAVLAVAAPHDGPLAGLVEHRGELELAGGRVAEHPRCGPAAEATHGPAGQRPGKFGDVRLTVAGADTEGVQLHDLAREILVESALLALTRGNEAPGLRVWPD